MLIQASGNLGHESRLSWVGSPVCMHCTLSGQLCLPQFWVQVGHPAPSQARDTSATSPVTQTSAVPCRHLLSFLLLLYNHFTPKFSMLRKCVPIIFSRTYVLSDLGLRVCLRSRG